MLIDNKEIGRLAIMLKRPAEFIERRTEDIEVLGDNYYRVRVSEQVMLASHADRQDPTATSQARAGATSETGQLLASLESTRRPTLIPLGEYAKHRLPDLFATGPSGEQLSILTRNDRAQVLATVYTGAWAPRFFGASDAQISDDARLLWDYVQEKTAEIVAATRSHAPPILEELKSTMQLMVEAVRNGASFADDAIAGVNELLGWDEFWEELTKLCNSTHLVAVLTTAPAALQVISIEYSERMSYGFREPRTDGGQAFHQMIHRWMMAALAWIGLIPISVRREAANSGACGSLHLKANLPTGVEAVRYYWLYERWTDPKTLPQDDVSCDRPVLSHFARDNHVHPDLGPAVLEVQMAPSLSLVAAIFTSAFIAFVATFIYQAHAPGNLSNSFLAIAAAFSGIPALLTGAIAFQTEPFSRWMSRGPRLVLGGLAGFTALLAASVGLRTFSNAFQTWLSFSVILYATASILVLTHIEAGPRYRLTDRSRLNGWTSRLSPATARQLQVWCALIFVLVSLILLLLTARVEHALRFCHVFTRDFPANVWNAATGGPVTQKMHYLHNGLLKTRSVCDV